MLRNQPGIQSVKVALLAERAVVEFDPTTWTTEKVIQVRCGQILYYPASTHYNMHRKSETLALTQQKYV